MSRVCIDLHRISNARSGFRHPKPTCYRFEQIVDADCSFGRFRGFWIDAFVVEIPPVLGLYDALVPSKGNCSAISICFGCDSGAICIQSFSTRSHWSNQLAWTRNSHDRPFQPLRPWPPSYAHVSLMAESKLIISCMRWLRSCGWLATLGSKAPILVRRIGRRAVMNADMASM